MTKILYKKHPPRDENCLIYMAANEAELLQWNISAVQTLRTHNQTACIDTLAKKCRYFNQPTRLVLAFEKGVWCIRLHQGSKSLEVITPAALLCVYEEQSKYRSAITSFLCMRQRYLHKISRSEPDHSTKRSFWVQRRTLHRGNEGYCT